MPTLILRSDSLLLGGRTSSAAQQAGRNISSRDKRPSRALFTLWGEFCLAGTPKGPERGQNLEQTLHEGLFFRLYLGTTFKARNTAGLYLGKT